MPKPSYEMKKIKEMEIMEDDWYMKDRKELKRKVKMEKDW